MILIAAKIIVSTDESKVSFVVSSAVQMSHPGRADDSQLSSWYSERHEE